MKSIYTLLIFLLFSLNINAQKTDNNETDEQQIEHLISQLYDCISFNDTKQFNDSLLATLFIDGAILVQSNGIKYKATSIYDYIENMQQLKERQILLSFEEKGMINKIEIQGYIATSLSSYETAMNLKGRENSQRGINNFSFLKVDGNWKVASISWIDENEDYKLPENYIKINDNNKVRDLQPFKLPVKE